MKPSTVQDCCRAMRPFATQSSRRVPRSFHTAASPPSPLCLDFLAPSWLQATQSNHRLQSNPAQTTRSHHLAQSRSVLRITPRRQFSTSRAHRAPAQVILNPRKDDDGNILTITITPRAAHRLTKIAETDNNPDLALRVTVESGGCHGFQYLMSLANAKDANAEEDSIFENEDVVGKNSDGDGAATAYKAKVIMDEPSLELLKGSSVDYTMELIGSQFKVTGIPGAKSSCGCGTSFDISA